MNLKQTINAVRRKLLHAVTKRITNRSKSNEGKFPGSAIEIKRILICRPNHRLGNLLLVTPLLQEVIKIFPHCTIDLFIKGEVAPAIFKNYNNIGKIIQLPKKAHIHFLHYIKGWVAIKTDRYDLVINVEKNSSSGRIATNLADSKYKIFGDEEECVSANNDHMHIAKYPVYNLRRHLKNVGNPDQQILLLNIKLEDNEIAHGSEILKKLVKNDKSTICLFTYATGAKCYSTSWWNELYGRLNTEYPGFNIIEVLPAENISKINFRAITYYSKDIREIGSVIANTKLFIGADSGIMHLASAAGAPTVGLFSVTDKNIYQPYNNNSIGINTQSTNLTQLIEIVDGILKKV